MLLDYTFFSPVHIGYYIRNLYFWKSINKLPMGTFKKVLDAGCGPGSYALQIANAFPSIEVHAVDIKKFPISKNVPSNCIFLQSDLRSLNSADTYDFIYSIDVLEHIPDNNKVLQNFYNALKSKGYLFIHIPDENNVTRIFPKKFFTEFDKWKEEEHIGEHYTLHQLESLIKSMGFSIISAEYTFGFLGQLAWELDRLTDHKIAIKIILMPILKVLSQISVRCKHSKGNILIVAQKNANPK